MADGLEVRVKRHCQHLCSHLQVGIDVLSRPWNGLILATLHERGPLRFSELAAQVGQIGDRMLSVRLKELETSGVLVRHVMPGPPVKVEYELTEAGRGFREVTEALAKWGSQLIAAGAAAPDGGHCPGYGEKSEEPEVEPRCEVDPDITPPL